MTYKEAIQLFEDNTNLIGEHYKGLLIDAIVVVPIHEDYRHLLKAAIQAKHFEYYLPNEQDVEYEVFVLFDLKDWLLSTLPILASIEALLYYMKHR